ncbi:unnamed protein product, partial [Laminaria digitata]
ARPLSSRGVAWARADLSRSFFGNKTKEEEEEEEGGVAAFILLRAYDQCARKEEAQLAAGTLSRRIRLRPVCLDCSRLSCAVRFVLLCVNSHGPAVVRAAFHVCSVLGGPVCLWKI